MTIDDHSVNMGKRYHHGDLRAAALRAGMNLIANRTDADLSLREVARSVGVSANALYRHFPDKDALMAALASEGLRALASAQREAYAASGGGPDGFAATGKAYVRFALDNPALFHLIFAQPARGLDDVNEPAALLRENAVAAAGEARDARTVAVQAWSLAHGLAMLVLNGHLNVDDLDLEGFFSGPVR